MFMVDFVLGNQWTASGKEITVSIDPKRVVALSDSECMDKKGLVPGCGIHTDTKGQCFVVLGTREEVKKKLRIEG